MPTLTVTVDGKEHQVEDTAIAFPETHSLFELDGQAPKGFHDDTALEAARSQEREKVKGRKNPADLVKDKDFHQRIFRHLGMQTGADGLPVGMLSDEDRKKLAQYDATHSRLETAEATIQTQEEAITTGRVATLKASLRSAFDADGTWLDRDKLESIFPGKDPPFLTDAADEFTWSDTHQSHVFKDEKGNPVMDGNKPAGVVKFAEILKKANPRLFPDRRTRGSRFDDSGSTPRGSTVTLSREDAKNVNLYRAALKQVDGDHSRLVVTE